MSTRPAVASLAYISRSKRRRGPPVLQSRRRKNNAYFLEEREERSQNIFGGKTNGMYEEPSQQMAVYQHTVSGKSDKTCIYRRQAFNSILDYVDRSEGDGDVKIDDLIQGD
ncbi:hypothetical protein P5673_009186 [Acropora cervicornis]|uniref:Uncharacterized protein n=1 Tax=Acropora cervicornis TaxID=6130 RepID=A0AAD9QSH4_ACRCE|nr:hypothetical protein P5673_009186 [Acropora cervicornis]